LGGPPELQPRRLPGAQEQNEPARQGAPACALPAGPSVHRPITHRPLVGPTSQAPRVGTGGSATSAPPLPGRFSGIKMKDEIQRDTPAERDMFVGGAPVVNREAEKDRLSKMVRCGAAG
jgi:hypothetical protein